MALPTERQHVMIAPEDIDLAMSHRFLRLPHPRTGTSALFLPVPQGASSDTLLEVQRVTPDADKGQSYFIDQHVASDGRLVILTPFDPVYLAMSLLEKLPLRYLAFSELWEAAAAQLGEEDDEMRDDILRFGALHCVKQRVAVICETQSHDGEILYRMSSSLVQDMLKSKVKALVEPVGGIFGPFEFITLDKTADVPIATVNHSDETGAAGGDTESDSQETVVDVVPAEKVFPTVSRGLGREGVGDGQGLSEELQLEIRTKAAVGIFSNYLSPSAATLLLSAYSFTALEAQIAATASSSVLSSTYLPGRSNSGDGESKGGGAAAAAAKKKQLAKKGSRGVEMLKKASTQGMKPISSFFAKKAAPGSTPPASKKRKVE